MKLVQIMESGWQSFNQHRKYNYTELFQYWYIRLKALAKPLPIAKLKEQK